MINENSLKKLEAYREAERTNSPEKNALWNGLNKDEKEVAIIFDIENLWHTKHYLAH